MLDANPINRKADSMLVAQITDMHIGFDTDNPFEYNRLRLDRILAHLRDGPNRPGILLATGDLTDKGDDGSYARLADVLSGCDWPVYPCVGNHDVRSAFSAQFPGFTDDEGFIQYVVDAGPLRLIVIDTLEEGRHGGAFCATRAAWLSARLAENRLCPTYIVMHHPPVDSGIDWMTTDPVEPWVARFTAALAGATNLRGLICGHLHCSLTVQWNGLTVAVCSSSAPQVALDLRPIDPEQPDDRAMIVADAPAYALHHWNGDQLVSFFHAVGDDDVLASFNVGMQPLVRSLIDERGA